MEDGKSNAAWRLFVAFSVPEAVKDEIEKAQRELRDAVPGHFMRWTKRDQFHLTLKFLGNVAEARVAELKEALSVACASFKTMRLRAERVGFFPDTRHPRVAWAGIHDQENELAQFQSAIETAVANFTCEKAEKRFVGHVTLARIQGIRRQQTETLSKVAQGMATRFFGEWTADKVELIRSQLSSGGARYTTLATFPLSGA